MGAIEISGAIIHLSVDEEVVAVVIARPLQCVVSENRITVTETLRYFSLKRVVVVIAAVRVEKNVLRPAESVEERTAVIPWHIREPYQSRLVAFTIRVITAEDMRALIPNVGCLNRYTVGQLVLHSHIPGIDGGEGLFEIHDSRSDTVRQEESSAGWKRCIGHAALIRRRSEPEEVSECRWALRQCEDAIEVIRGSNVLYGEYR